MKTRFFAAIALCGLAMACTGAPQTSGNPVFEGLYADPEASIYEGEYWIYPTYSAATYEEQLHMDAFSSPDLVHWTKHENIIDNNELKWLWRALWAPSTTVKDGKYYLFFSCNDVHPGEIGGIGVAIADSPAGPFKDLIGGPMIQEVINGAQPIDQMVFHDPVSDEYYMYYGGWGHCNMVRLGDDLIHLVPFEDGTIYKEITPNGYVEGSYMLYRNGIYYFMWSEGCWENDDYAVAYAMSDNPFGPFERIGTVLSANFDVATGAGHNSVIKGPGEDEWFIVYHRHPLPELDADGNPIPVPGNVRNTCIDKLEFNEDNTIKPVTITFEGVSARPIK